MMLYNPNYYNNLLNNYPENIPSPFEAQISRRETTIGYCQGFNFIVGKILKICGNEVIIFLFILIFS